MHYKIGGQCSEPQYSLESQQIRKQYQMEKTTRRHTKMNHRCSSFSNGEQVWLRLMFERWRRNDSSMHNMDGRKSNTNRSRSLMSLIFNSSNARISHITINRFCRYEILQWIHHIISYQEWLETSKSRKTNHVYQTDPESNLQIIISLQVLI